MIPGAQELLACRQERVQRVYWNIDSITPGLIKYGQERTVGNLTIRGNVITPQGPAGAAKRRSRDGIDLPYVCTRGLGAVIGNNLGQYLVHLS